MIVLLQRSLRVSSGSDQADAFGGGLGRGSFPFVEKPGLPFPSCSRPSEALSANQWPQSHAKVDDLILSGRPNQANVNVSPLGHAGSDLPWRSVCVPCPLILPTQLSHAELVLCWWAVIPPCRRPQQPSRGQIPGDSWPLQCLGQLIPAHRPPADFPHPPLLCVVPLFSALAASALAHLQTDTVERSAPLAAPTPLSVAQLHSFWRLFLQQPSISPPAREPDSQRLVAACVGWIVGRRLSVAVTRFYSPPLLSPQSDEA